MIESRCRTRVWVWWVCLISVAWLWTSCGDASVAPIELDAADTADAEPPGDTASSTDGDLAAEDTDGTAPGEDTDDADVETSGTDAALDVDDVNDLADVGAPDGDDTAVADTGTLPTDTGAMDTAPVDMEPEIPARYLVEMTYTTANIGRNYGNKADVQQVFNKIGDIIGPKSGPKFIGWQEISEADPCGDGCEWDALENRFKTEWGWDNRRPNNVKVPVTAKGASNDDVWVRRVFASPGWAGVSPTRYVTVVHYKQRNVSVLNTHFIAGAWSCKSNVEQRKDYWRQAWRALKDEVAKEHDKGRNVIVTGDLNRPRGSNGCNPAWDPTALHARARIVGGAGIDYVFAVPAAGYGFSVSTRNDGSKKRGDITLGIDGHKAHWVTGEFFEK